ncbi:MAG: ATP-dependent DNA helicase [Nitrospira sp.]
MLWSPRQDKALQQVANWLNDPSAPQVFRLFGYAGTGKTTLARHFAEGVEDVLFAAYTGKAAHVLQQKGCEGASTIHSLIYHTADKSTVTLKELEKALEELTQQLTAEGQDPQLSKKAKELAERIRIEKTNVSRPSFRLNFDSPVRKANLIVIDECSMVDGQMGEDLLSFGTKVLVLGDPAQLPPVGGAGYFTEGVKPDVMLDEIHRQAEDNPIIEMATKVRNGVQLSYGDYGNSRVIEPHQMTAELALGVDQIIVGRNKTRFAYNKRLRELHNRTDPMPMADDKLVCLRNNHDLGLLNGAIWRTISASPPVDNRVWLKLEAEDGRQLEAQCHSQVFTGDAGDIPFYERKEAEEFDFGYALTCHKSQGSQWGSVLVMDESWCFRQDRWRWLYTAITRAAEQVVVVRS